MNVEFGYRCASEEHPAQVLLRNAQTAEKLGFDFIVTSDHFHPWFHTDGHSTFALSWLGALGQVTSRVWFGTGVTPPILRYHPALVAQAFATLSNLYPARVFLGVGTGEAMNEVPLGFEWPSYTERLERLKEAIFVIRSLWSNDFVSFQGKYFTLKGANLYDKPQKPPLIYVAGVGTNSTLLASQIGDGYMTVPAKPDIYKRNFEILKNGCEKRGVEFESFPKMVEVFVGYDEDYDKALNHLRRWKTVLIPNVLNREIYDPRVLQELSKSVDDSELLNTQAKVCTTIEDLVKVVEEYVRYGFNKIQLHSCSPNEQKFLFDFGTKCLPFLKEEFRA
jgi:Coenzyme F420-dependent N5,N10-methylene tetrahydromethanopterin reductase and related flavin-dependent oxidoreductases